MSLLSMAFTMEKISRLLTKKKSLLYQRLSMDAVRGVCVLCKEEKIVLSKGNDTIFELLKTHHCGNDAEYIELWKSCNLENSTGSICTYCAYKINCCVRTRLAFKSQKPKGSSENKCSICYTSENIVYNSWYEYEDISSFLRGLCTRPPRVVKKICLNCIFCVDTWKSTLKLLVDLKSNLKEEKQKEQSPIRKSDKARRKPLAIHKSSEVNSELQSRKQRQFINEISEQNNTTVEKRKRRFVSIDEEEKNKTPEKKRKLTPSSDLHTMPEQKKVSSPTSKKNKRRNLSEKNSASDSDYSLPRKSPKIQLRASITHAQTSKNPECGKMSDLEKDKRLKHLYSVNTLKKKTRLNLQQSVINDSQMIFSIPYILCEKSDLTSLKKVNKPRGRKIGYNKVGKTATEVKNVTKIAVKRSSRLREKQTKSTDVIVVSSSDEAEPSQQKTRSVRLRGSMRLLKNETTKTSNNNVKKKEIQCKYCDLKFATRYILKLHELEHETSFSPKIRLRSRGQNKESSKLNGEESPQKRSNVNKRTRKLKTTKKGLVIDTELQDKNGAGATSDHVNGDFSITKDKSDVGDEENIKLDTETVHLELSHAIGANETNKNDAVEENTSDISKDVDGSPLLDSNPAGKGDVENMGKNHETALSKRDGSTTFGTESPIGEEALESSLKKGGSTTSGIESSVEEDDDTLEFPPKRPDLTSAAESYADDECISPSIGENHSNESSPKSDSSRRSNRSVKFPCEKDDLTKSAPEEGDSTKSVVEGDVSPKVSCNRGRPPKKRRNTTKPVLKGDDSTKFQLEDDSHKDSRKRGHTSSKNGDETKRLPEDDSIKVLRKRGHPFNKRDDTDKSTIEGGDLSKSPSAEDDSTKVSPKRSHAVSKKDDSAKSLIEEKLIESSPKESDSVEVSPEGDRAASKRDDLAKSSIEGDESSKSPSKDGPTKVSPRRGRPASKKEESTKSSPEESQSVEVTPKRGRSTRSSPKTSNLTEYPTTDDSSVKSRARRNLSKIQECTEFVEEERVNDEPIQEEGLINKFVQEEGLNDELVQEKELNNEPAEEDGPGDEIVQEKTLNDKSLQEELSQELEQEKEEVMKSVQEESLEADSSDKVMQEEELNELNEPLQEKDDESLQKLDKESLLKDDESVQKTNDEPSQELEEKKTQEVENEQEAVADSASVEDEISTAFSTTGTKGLTEDGAEKITVLSDDEEQSKPEAEENVIEIEDDELESEIKPTENTNLNSSNVVEFPLKKSLSEEQTTENSTVSSVGSRTTLTGEQESEKSSEISKTEQESTIEDDSEIESLKYSSQSSNENFSGTNDKHSSGDANAEARPSTSEDSSAEPRNSSTIDTIKYVENLLENLGA